MKKIITFSRCSKMNGSAVAKQEIELEETKSLKINIPVFGNKYFNLKIYFLNLLIQMYRLFKVKTKNTTRHVFCVSRYILQVRE